MTNPEGKCDKFKDFSTKRRGLGTCGLCAKAEKCPLEMAVARRKSLNPRQISTGRFLGESSTRDWQS